jgi:hypothetical protein
VPELASFSNKARLLGRGVGLDKHRRANPIKALQIKMQFGKLALHLPLADVLRDQQQQNGLVLEPVTLEDILALSALAALPRDRSTALYL